REHVSVRGADDGLAERADQPEQLREPLRPEVAVNDRRVGREAGQVRAGGEHLVVRGGEDDAADVVVVAGDLEGGDQLCEQFVRERVARVRLIERDRGDAVAGVVPKRFERRSRSSHSGRNSFTEQGGPKAEVGNSFTEQGGPKAEVGNSFTEQGGPKA